MISFEYTDPTDAYGSTLTIAPVDAATYNGTTPVVSLGIQVHADSSDPETPIVYVPVDDIEKVLAEIRGAARVAAGASSSAAPSAPTPAEQIRDRATAEIADHVWLDVDGSPLALPPTWPNVRTLIDAIHTAAGLDGAEVRIVWTDEAPATAPQPAPADRAAVLSDRERQFLSFALDMAAEELSLGAGFTDEDRAAHDLLRRMADEAQHEEHEHVWTSVPANGAYGRLFGLTWTRCATCGQQPADADGAQQPTGAASIALTRDQLAGLLAHHADVIADAFAQDPAAYTLRRHAAALTADKEIPLVAELLDGAMTFPGPAARGEVSPS